MKTLKIVSLVVVGLVVVVIAALVFTFGVQRSYSRLNRGDYNHYFWLGGEHVTTPVTDWSFIDSIREIQVRTRTPYLLPHTIHTDVVQVGGKVYLYSIYTDPDRFPEEMVWHRNVVRDPRVRIKIGDRLFDMRIIHLTDPSEMQVARQAFIAKYYSDLPPDREPPPVRHGVFFRVEQVVASS
jgi:hypothetical protein